MFAMSSSIISRRLFTHRLASLALTGSVLHAAPLEREIRANDEHASPTIWLDANEYPDGPPPSAVAAIVRSAAATGRYHFDEFGAFNEAIARSEQMRPDQILFGVGSGEIIDAAICAFTSHSRPMITAIPTYDVATDFAQSLGRKVVQLPMTEQWTFPVRELAEQAYRYKGGLIYICNPNNPTSSLTPQNDIDWLASNLPPNTTLLVDEAYIHFVEPTNVESAIKHVRHGRNVVVTRTFSKIYGMAGARVGFGCAKPDLVLAMQPFRDNVVPILGLRAATAALADRTTLILDRRANIARIRHDFCDWLEQKHIAYIKPQANFVLIDIERDVKTFSYEMFRRGVAVGRPFPSFDHMLRVTFGTDREMAKFRQVFEQVIAGE